MNSFYRENYNVKEIREEANKQTHCAATIVKRTAENQGSWPQLIGSLVSKVEISNAQ